MWRKRLLTFFSSVGERICFTDGQKFYTYHTLAQAIQQPTPTEEVDTKLTWHGLVVLLRAALQHQSFSFDKSETTEDRSNAGLWLQTTGSTGMPKRVFHSWDNWLAQYRWKARDEKALLQAMAFDHIGGLHSIFYALSRGMQLVVPANLASSAVKKALQEHKVFLLPTTPAHLALLLQSGCFDETLPDLKMISYGAEAMSCALQKSISLRQPHLRWRETYGSTETGILPLCSGSVPGLWVPNFPFKVVDGELHTQNLRGEWQASGDFVEVLPDGKLHFLGRQTTRTKIGGISVTSVQLSAWLRQQAHVWQVEVVPVANPILGQVFEARLWVAKDANVRQIEKQIRASILNKFPKEVHPVRYTFEKQGFYNKRLKQLQA